MCVYRVLYMYVIDMYMYMCMTVCMHGCITVSLYDILKGLNTHLMDFTIFCYNMNEMSV